MKPSLLKKLTSGFDPLAWLSVADALEEAGEPSEPWRMRGLVGLAVDGWITAYAAQFGGNAFSQPYKPLPTKLPLPDGYSLTPGLLGGDKFVFAIWREDRPGKPRRMQQYRFYKQQRSEFEVRAQVFRIAREIANDQRSHASIKSAAATVATATAPPPGADQSPGPSTSPPSRPLGMLALRSLDP